MKKAHGKTVRVTLQCDRPMCFIPAAIDPKALFGKVRTPVKMKLPSYSYRSAKQSETRARRLAITLRALEGIDSDAKRNVGSQL